MSGRQRHGTFETEVQVEMAYYCRGYDATLPRLDFAVEDTIGTSQRCSATVMQTTSYFQGNDLIATAKNDVGNSGSGPDNFVAQESTFFHLSNTKYNLIPHTGHDINLHYFAPYCFWKVHQWPRKEV